MEQNAIYLMKIGSVLRKLQLFKTTSSNLYYYVAGLIKRTLNSSANMHFPDPVTCRNKIIVI